MGRNETGEKFNENESAVLLKRKTMERALAAFFPRLLLYHPASFFELTM